MQDNTLQRFQQFKATFVSSNVPNNVLLELIESFITTDDNELAVEDNPVLDGQLSLFEITMPGQDCLAERSAA